MIKNIICFLIALVVLSPLAACFCSDFPAFEMKSSLPNPNPQVDELDDWAAPFVEEAVFFASIYGKGFENEIVEYIANVLYDPDFQNDPEQFMEEWADRRGLTKEFRVVEDSARLFFLENDGERLEIILNILK